jgi:hypothetical protein
MGINSAGSKNTICNNIWVVFVALIIGTFSIFTASSIRELFESLLQISVPLGEKSIGGGTLLVWYRLFYFLIILSLLVIVSVLLV